MAVDKFSAQSRYHQSDKKDKESPNDFENRTWREKCHSDDSGNIFIPPMSFKNCIGEAAKFISMQVKGKGKSTWTKHFEAGILVMDALKLPFNKDSISGEWIMCNANGRPGPGTRVPRCFPLIPKWEGDVVFHIIDNEITEDVFKTHLKEAGQLIGIGRFRPRNRGFYGRFEVVGVKWQDLTSAAA